MKNSSESLNLYNKLFNLIDSNNFNDAVNYLKSNINHINDIDDIALAYLNCAFINYKLKNYGEAIDDFSQAIYFEEKIDSLKFRSKDISYNGRSNSRYKKSNFKGAVEDKRIAREIKIIEKNKLSIGNKILIDYKRLTSGSYDHQNFEMKYQILIKTSKLETSKYDLIEDYKKVINDSKKEELRNKLYALSESKYHKGDYKGSIRTLRRAEKYF